MGSQLVLLSATENNEGAEANCHLSTLYENFDCLSGYGVEIGLRLLVEFRYSAAVCQLYYSTLQQLSLRMDDCHVTA